MRSASALEAACSSAQHNTHSSRPSMRSSHTPPVRHLPGSCFPACRRSLNSRITSSLTADQQERFTRALSRAPSGRLPSPAKPMSSYRVTAAREAWGISNRKR